MNDGRSSGAVDAADATATIVCDRVTRRYANGPEAVLALSGFSGEFRAGEAVAVTGPSGSGKSTLLALLAAIDYADEGTIRVNGTELGGLSTVEQAEFRGQSISYLYPEYNLLPMLSVYENISLALSLKRLPEFEIDRRIRDTLGELDLTGLEYRKPSALSSGQRARAALARALAARNPVLIADEPTAHLDEDNAIRVARLLAQAAAAGHLVIIATHDPAVAAHADRAVELRAASDAQSDA